MTKKVVLSGDIIAFTSLSNEGKITLENVGGCPAIEVLTHLISRCAGLSKILVLQMCMCVYSSAPTPRHLNAQTPALRQRLDILTSRQLSNSRCPPCLNA